MLGMARIIGIITRRGLAGLCKAGLCGARLCEARLVMALQGKARNRYYFTALGDAGHGFARQGQAGQCSAWLV
jgi:hypothetical protein